MRKPKPNVVKLLKPALDKAISEVFKVPETEVMNGEKRDFLPRQTVLYVLKEKYSCPDGQIRKIYKALPRTIQRACGMVGDIVKAGGDNAKNIVEVEAKLLTEILSNSDLKSTLEAARNGQSPDPISEELKTSATAGGASFSPCTTKDKRVDYFVKQLSKSLRELLLQDILVTSNAEESVSKARKFFLYLLWEDGGMSFEEIKQNSPGVKDDDIFAAIGSVIVTVRDDKSAKELLKSIRESI